MRVLAFDLGAESGRAILGAWRDGRLELEEVHRFANGPVRVGPRLYWDVLRLFGEMKAGLALAAKRGALASLGVDTWGVDFALLGSRGELLGNPRHYRDPHTESMPAEAFATVPAAELFAGTGVQFLRFNSLFQWLAMRRDCSDLLPAARRLLLMPDLFHYWFCGEAANEITNASTTQMLEPFSRRWNSELLTRFGLEPSLLGPLVPPGTRLGALLPELREETGAGAVPVLAPATHDTAAAVAGVPAQGSDWAYLSSGTWSLLGLELEQPLVNAEVQSANATNEAGVGGTVRFLKNIMGLWLVQECRRAWRRDGLDLEYDELLRQAEAAPAFVSLVDPDDATFMLPASMPGAIAAFCERTRQPVPSGPGAFIRCCLESLALKYRFVLERLRSLAGRAVRTLHIVGGGSQNRLLNQWTANATGCQVIAGPVEATAAGNLLTQLLGLGELGSLAEGREALRCSFPLRTFEPSEPEAWEAAAARFSKLVS